MLVSQQSQEIQKAWKPL